MELRIYDQHGFIDQEFGKWLIPRIQVKLVSSIPSYASLVNWDNYLTSSDTLSQLYKRTYKASEIVLFASKNLVCTGTDGEISIHFNNTKFVPGFNRLKLETIIKTINYGTIDTKGCSIFKDSFDYFAKDIDSYVRQYYML